MSHSLLLSNGRVVDGTGAEPFVGSVLIQGAEILAVGERADARARHVQELRRLDVAGMTVMPGLIDAHCHLSFDDATSNLEIFHQRRNALSALVASYNARKLLRAGVTSILDPDSVHENMLDLRDAIEAGVVPGPRMSCGCYALITAVGGTAGGLIADEGVTGYYKVVQGETQIVSEVRRQIKAGADWIKVHVSGVVPRYAQLGERCSFLQEELDLICRVAHDMGVPVMGHCRGAEATYRAAKAGMDLIFHATGMDERALQAVIDRRIPVAPCFTFQANMVDFGHRLGTDPALIALFEREIQDSADSMIALHRAGVPLLAGSESGFSMVPYGHWHYREMDVFRRYFGLSALQAIQCATQMGAHAMKMAGRLGVIAPGMKADVLCVAGDPLEDLSVLGRSQAIRHVFVDGREQDLSPLEPRRNIAGWRMPMMGRALTPRVARGESAELGVEVNELH